METDIGVDHHTSINPFSYHSPTSGIQFSRRPPSFSYENCHYALNHFSLSVVTFMIGQIKLKMVDYIFV